MFLKVSEYDSDESPFIPLKIQKLGARSGMPNETELIDFLKKNEENYF
ncbi:MAG: hypothetical protein ACTSPU_16240 [Promethearchaeota archaeon]